MPFTSTQQILRDHPMSAMGPGSALGHAEKAMLDPRPALDAAMDANHSSMSELESVLSGLEQRLQSVLRQPVPQTAGGAMPQPVPDVSSPSVESLRTLRQRLTASILRVHDLMDRLET